MIENGRAEGMPSLDDDLRLPDEGVSPAAAAAGAVIAGAANTASAMLGLIARRRRARQEAGDGEPAGQDEINADSPPAPQAEIMETPDDSDEIPVMTVREPVTRAEPEIEPEPGTGADAGNDNEVLVRVSPRAPRERTSRKRQRGLTQSLLDTVVNQVGDYVKESPAVERLVRVQTERVLRELKNDPALAELVRAQAEQYIDELLAHPAKLEALVRLLRRTEREQAAVPPQKTKTRAKHGTAGSRPRGTPKQKAGGSGPPTPA
jgi:hypothetical protein